MRHLADSNYTLHELYAYAIAHGFRDDAARVKDYIDLRQAETGRRAMSYDTQLNDDQRADLAQRLDRAGWPSVGDDIRDGLTPETVLSRLNRIGVEGEDVESATEVVAAYVGALENESCPRCDKPGISRGKTREGTAWNCESCGLPFQVLAT